MTARGGEPLGIREELAGQMKQALKAGEKARLQALRMIRAEFEVAQTSGKDFDETDVVKGHANRLRKSLAEYEQLGLDDRVSQLREELRVVEEFLPRQMRREELEQLIVAVIDEQGLGPGDIGRLMRTVMSEHGDVVDGRVAQEIARARLAERS